MSEFTVHSAEQLPALLQAYRKQAGLTQAETAMRLGVTQQTLSALERHSDKISADRLLQVLHLYGVELVLRQASETSSSGKASGSEW